MADAAGVTLEHKLEQYRPLIEQALAYTDGEWTWDMVCEEVLSGRAFLMPSQSGKTVAIVQPVRSLHVFTASGEMDELMGMEADVSRMARDAGYDNMTVRGREGWERVLQTRGWKRWTGLIREL